MKCPSCNNKIGFFTRRKQYIQCKNCKANLVMANYYSAHWIMLFFTCLFFLAMIVNPVLGFGVLAIEIIFHYKFSPLNYYKIYHDSANNT